MKLNLSNIENVFKSEKCGIETMELKGYELIKNLFVDNSGLGQPDELALTRSQFIDELTNIIGSNGQVYTTITAEGQFQVYLGVFKKVGKSKGVRIAKNVLELDENGKHTIRLYDTNIIVFDGGKITLDSGGFRTSTTKKWMNKYLPARYMVKQQNFEWVVADSETAKVIPFVDGMEL